jgi:hypothetical protein
MKKNAELKHLKADRNGEQDDPKSGHGRKMRKRKKGMRK